MFNADGVMSDAGSERQEVVASDSGSVHGSERRLSSAGSNGPPLRVNEASAPYGTTLDRGREDEKNHTQMVASLTSHSDTSPTRINPDSSASLVDETQSDGESSNDKTFPAHTVPEGTPGRLRASSSTTDG
ncbi:hypothetical protein EIP86_009056 [Pleurotus ostreatoroseus]|nr:hypothetical protein EIP86_009056 [Pleurotus ostreatoroseus]